MRRKTSVALIVFLALLMTTACSQKDGGKSMVEAKSVQTATVKTEQAERISELSSTLQPSEEATVSFEVSGRITEMNKNEGDQVKAGDVLASIDASAYSLQVEQADTTIAQTSASLEKVTKGAREEEIAQVKVQLDKAKIGFEKAQDDFAKFSKLYKESAISQNDYDNAKRQLELAQKDMDNAQQAYSLTVQGARQEDRQMQKSTYDQAVIAKQQAALTLNKTQLKAPLTGTIIAKLGSAGQLTSTGTPVYRIGNVDTLKVVLPVPDYEIPAWKVGEKVALSLYEHTREATVTKIYPSTNQSTGTIGVEVSVPNQQHDWYAGQVVKASKRIESKEGIYVPVGAVINQGEPQPYVFLAVGGKAVKTSVTIGELINNKLEIRSGLKPGDEVVIKGVDRLFDGDVIEPAGGTQQ